MHEISTIRTQPKLLRCPEKGTSFGRGGLFVTDARIFQGTRIGSTMQTPIQLNVSFAASHGKGERSLGFLSITLPTKDEVALLTALPPRLHAWPPQADIIVVDDGPIKDTSGVCKSNCHGSSAHDATISRGAYSSGDQIPVFVKGDGQRDPVLMVCLLAQLKHGHNLVVGGRQGRPR